MFSESDVLSVYGFLKDTPEGPLRKMLIGGEMSEAYFRLMMKVVRGCQAPEFVAAFTDESIPKIRLTPAEYPLKEHFWRIAKGKWQNVGLLGAQAKAA